MDLVQLLIAVVSVYRYEGEEIDEGVAHSEANILGDEIQGGALKGEEIIRILSTRSKAQLIATFNNYKQIHGTSITKVYQDTMFHVTINIRVSLNFVDVL